MNKLFEQTNIIIVDIEDISGKEAIELKKNCEK